MTSSPTPSTLLEASVALPELTCTECGMLCAVREFHPFAACLMFKACRDSDKVRANLAFIRELVEANVRAELARSAQAVPADMVLVPREPTQEMCQQGQWKAQEWPKFPLRISPIYKAMLAAAPTALPAVAPQVADEGREPVAGDRAPTDVFEVSGKRAALFAQILALGVTNNPWRHTASAVIYSKGHEDALQAAADLLMKSDLATPAQTTGVHDFASQPSVEESLANLVAEQQSRAVPAQTGEVARLVEEAKNTAGEYGIAKQRNNEFDNRIGVNRTRKDLFAAIDRLAALAHSPTVASPAADRDFAFMRFPEVYGAPALVAEVGGLPIDQEPKYTVNGSAIVNRASGEAIPADEPVFIFRARDRHAMEALKAYANTIPLGTTHWHAVIGRHGDFEQFAADHPERMKEPDTAASPVVIAGEKP